MQGGPGGKQNSPINPSSLGANLYIPSLATSSLKSFYDDVIYWEIAKGTNKFFVTFERGNYAIRNNGQESIATMEIDYPHSSFNTGSHPSGANFTTSASLGGSRNNVRYDAFFQDDELNIGNNSGDFTGSMGHHRYDGFITTTQIKGTRFWQSTITSSLYKNVSYSYEVMHNENVNGGPYSITTSRQFSASYFYPFSSYQLSVLRKSPTLIIDLDKDSELGSYRGSKGFVAIPDQSHQKIKDNLEFYLEKAGILNKTVKFKSPKKGR